MKRANNEIEKILNSLSGICPARAKPFMYTRIMARMQEEHSFWGRAIGVLSKPWIAISCMFILLSANIYAIVHAQNEDYSEPTSTTALSSSNLNDVLQNDSYILAVK